MHLDQFKFRDQKIFKDKDTDFNVCQPGTFNKYLFKVNYDID